MANLKSSQKDTLKSQRKRCHNTSRKSMLRTFLKKVVLAISVNNKDLAKKEFYKVQPILDRLAIKKVIHKNKAARYKSRLCLKINNLS
ncbi:30S ribosomal protein S20 [Buchnera aphidicola (Phyllaphis fagi)]|uniref:30S ribosomal protein S20 n=1 Tax=Buchnera aphidicola TaxID=9 RepID=UPI003463915C